MHGTGAWKWQHHTQAARMAAGLHKLGELDANADKLEMRMEDAGSRFEESSMRVTDVYSGAVSNFRRIKLFEIQCCNRWSMILGSPMYFDKQRVSAKARRFEG